MKHSEEKFVKHGVVIPLIIAIVITALFFAVYNIALKAIFLRKENSVCRIIPIHRLRRLSHRILRQGITK